MATSFYANLAHHHAMDADSLWATSSDVSELHHLWYLKVTITPECGMLNRNASPRTGLGDTVGEYRRLT
jgi:hypothetical protein